MSFYRTKINLLGLIGIKGLKKKVMGLKKTVGDFLVMVKPNLVEKPKQILTAPKQDILAAIILSAAGKSLPEKLRSILTCLYLGKASQRHLLVNKDK